MGQPSETSGQHAHWLDDRLVRNPSEDERTEVGLWDSPGHDGVVSEVDSDPDRADLRSEIGRYVSLARFPTTVADLIALARDKDAPDEVQAELSRLAPADTYANAAQVWHALGLSSGQRF